MKAKEVLFGVYGPLRDTTLPPFAKTADAVISTLVLEHLPLATFFGTMAAMLNSSGYLLVSSAHPDMGAMSEAAFEDPSTGDRIWGTSHVYTIGETITEAKKARFELLELRDKVAEEDMRGARGGGWKGVMCWLGLVFKRSVGSSSDENDGNPSSGL